MKRDKWTPSKYSYICSAHLNVIDYAVPLGQPYTKLKKSAVPSKFNFPCHLLPKTKPARSPIAYVKLPSNVANTSVSNRKEACNVKEHSYCMKDKTATRSPTKAKLRKKIKNLQQKLRRQNLKISSLTGLIKNMRNRKLLEKAPAELLQDQFSGLTVEMFQNQIKTQCENQGVGGTMRRLKNLL